jgi:hypothetical protein
MENDNLFDCSSMMIRIDQLTREIYQNILNHQYATNMMLIEELLYQNRKLQLWNKQMKEGVSADRND